jgi:hypothetical protein
LLLPWDTGNSRFGTAQPLRIAARETYLAAGRDANAKPDFTEVGIVERMSGISDRGVSSSDRRETALPPTNSLF